LQPLDVAAILKDFPLLSADSTRERGLVYLDSAASSQKPLQVIEAMSEYYRCYHANVHRGVYQLAETATAMFESARVALGRFVNAFEPSREIVFTRNATEAINLVASSWGWASLREGDVVVLTEMEHHANIVPWHMLAERKGIKLRFVGITEDGYLDTSRLDELLDGAKLFCFTLASNVLGTLPEASKLSERAHAAGALVLVDAAQYSPHIPTDVRAIGCDFLALTGHKMLGPTGIGALWARRELLEEMPPYQGGGEMISDVTLEGFAPTEVPWKFEAGTPPIAEAVGLGAAIDYLGRVGLERIRAHEVKLLAYGLELLDREFGEEIRIYGPKAPEDRTGVISFSLRDIHPHDISQVLDAEGICIRAGHHCAKPLMRRLGVPATARASVYLYNTTSDLDKLAEGLHKVIKFFSD
jgi:cysteine desulfurase/selenocysteine lyase